MIAFSGRLDAATYAKAVRNMSLSWLYVGVPVLLVAVILVLTRPNQWVLAVFVALFGVSMLLAPRRMARRVFKSSATIDAPHRFTADDDRLTIETPYTTSNLPWRLFYNVYVSKNLILLYISAAQAHIVPRSFFATEEEWEASGP